MHTVYVDGITRGTRAEQRVIQVRIDLLVVVLTACNRKSSRLGRHRDGSSVPTGAICQITDVLAGVVLPQLGQVSSVKHPDGCDVDMATNQPWADDIPVYVQTGRVTDS
jgi:hypothetical protein